MGRSRDNKVASRDLPAATFASWSYQSEEKRPRSIFGYELLPSLSDFQTAVYYSSKDNQCYIAYRGSVTKDDWVDSDRHIAKGTLGKSSRAKENHLVSERVDEFFRQRGQTPRIVYTGHSLGGASALYEANANNRQAVVFNPGLSVLTKRATSMVTKRESVVYRTKDDAVSQSNATQNYRTVVVPERRRDISVKAAAFAKGLDVAVSKSGSATFHFLNSWLQSGLRLGMDQLSAHSMDNFVPLQIQHATTDNPLSDEYQSFEDVSGADEEVDTPVLDVAEGVAEPIRIFSVLEVLYRLANEESKAGKALRNVLRGRPMTQGLTRNGSSAAAADLLEMVAGEGSARLASRGIGGNGVIREAIHSRLTNAFKKFANRAGGSLLQERIMASPESMGRALADVEREIRADPKGLVKTWVKRARASNGYKGLTAEIAETQEEVAARLITMGAPGSAIEALADPEFLNNFQTLDTTEQNWAVNRWSKRVERDATVSLTKAEKAEKELYGGIGNMYTEGLKEETAWQKSLLDHRNGSRVTLNADQKKAYQLLMEMDEVGVDYAKAERMLQNAGLPGGDIPETIRLGAGSEFSTINRYRMQDIISNKTKMKAFIEAPREARPVLFYNTQYKKGKDFKRIVRAYEKEDHFNIEPREHLEEVSDDGYATPMEEEPDAERREEGKYDDEGDPANPEDYKDPHDPYYEPEVLVDEAEVEEGLIKAGVGLRNAWSRSQYAQIQSHRNAFKNAMNAEGLYEGYTLEERDRWMAAKLVELASQHGIEMKPNVVGRFKIGARNARRKVSQAVVQGARKARAGLSRTGARIAYASGEVSSKVGEVTGKVGRAIAESSETGAKAMEGVRWVRQGASSLAEGTVDAVVRGGAYAGKSLGELFSMAIPFIDAAVLTYMVYDLATFKYNSDQSRIQAIRAGKDPADPFRRVDGFWSGVGEVFSFHYVGDTIDRLVNYDEEQSHDQQLKQAEAQMEQVVAWAQKMSSHENITKIMTAEAERFQSGVDRRFDEIHSDVVAQGLHGRMLNGKTYHQLDQYILQNPRVATTAAFIFPQALRRFYDPTVTPSDYTGAVEFFQTYVRPRIDAFDAEYIYTMFVLNEARESRLKSPTWKEFRKKYNANVRSYAGLAGNRLGNLKNHEKDFEKESEAFWDEDADGTQDGVKFLHDKIKYTMDQMENVVGISSNLNDLSVEVAFAHTVYGMVLKYCFPDNRAFNPLDQRIKQDSTGTLLYHETYADLYETAGAAGLKTKDVYPETATRKGWLPSTNLGPWDLLRTGEDQELLDKLFREAAQFGRHEDETARNLNTLRMGQYASLALEKFYLEVAANPSNEEMNEFVKDNMESYIEINRDMAKETVRKTLSDKMTLSDMPEEIRDTLASQYSNDADEVQVGKKINRLEFRNKTQADDATFEERQVFGSLEGFTKKPLTPAVQKTPQTYVPVSSDGVHTSADGDTFIFRGKRQRTASKGKEIAEASQKRQRLMLGTPTRPNQNQNSSTAFDRVLGGYDVNTWSGYQQT